MKLKYPTPEEFENDYGYEYPDDGAVYYNWDYVDSKEEWYIDTFAWVKELQQDKRFTNFTIVVACTPWGKPPVDWRP